jgi:protocatechuate 3,4-dioxygenase beta subunit
MHNDDIPIGRIFTRRELLALLGATSAGLLAGCTSGGGTSNTSGNSGSSGNVNVVATPALTEGPFFVDERLNRSNIATGTARAAVVNGLPLALRLGVYTLSGGVAAPLSGAQVDIWHCDAIGVYSDESSGGIQSENTSGQNWLRGYQLANQSGVVEFATIYPGWYAGRTIHIHFKVRLFASGGATAYDFTSQFFIDDSLNDIVLANAPYNGRGARSVRNANDGIYTGTGSDSIIDGTQLTLNLTPTSSGGGYTATFNIGLQIP